MKELIKASEAKKLFSDSEERKDELIKLFNDKITEAAQLGKRNTSFPQGVSKAEAEYMADSLTINGFKVSQEKKSIYW